jgi:RimJ/RimL family protein N-acetyltransferase
VVIVPSIRTERLILFPATIELLEAERDPHGEFSDLLQAEVASPWPPPLNDEASRAWMIDLLRTVPEPGRWGMYYFLLRREGALPIAIGNGGYKGPPSAEGTVEIGYSIVESYQRRGLGAEAATGLVRHAFEDPVVKSVIAETFPHLAGSIGVLRKVGFTRRGEGSEPGAIRFELRHEDWLRGRS